ncbi:hypothetical protein [Micromonospora echinofusca]|uniref:Holin-X, holin superfamily III n=1 Tax=Micromonospora echinofusca TaxID=47858 RepID=A0ABS3VVN8_MICEH|nr:hypothetical protein [Micromonospora echinofusca]MBO4208611.1 hypothetical protein [Micromonospora echinofusca]
MTGYPDRAPGGAGVPPTVRAGRTARVGLVLFAAGLLGTAASCAGMAALTRWDIPLARLFGIVVVGVVVVAVVAVVRGLLALVQGLTGYVRSRRR